MLSSSTTATRVRRVESEAVTRRRGITRVIRVAAISVLAVAAANPGISDAATCLYRWCPTTTLPITTPTTTSTGTSTTTTTSTTSSAPKILSYEVTLNSLELVSTTGVKAEVLSAPMNVDLAQTIDLEDAVNSGLIPVGSYITANVVIDYSHALITADDGTGKAITLTPLDGSGAPVSAPQAVTMTLAGGKYFTASLRNGALSALNFNLAASTQVSIPNATATLAPTMVAAVVPSGNTWVRIHGTFTTADPANNAFVITVPPSTVVNAVVQGPVTVELSPTTTYLIYGASYNGTNGASVVEALPIGTYISVTGSLHTDHTTVAAATVVATQP